MPYQSNQELPQDVRESLPEDAQDVYRQAYNVACDPARSDREQDETAAKEAWMAVESEYEWKDNQWERREDGRPFPKNDSKDRGYGRQAPARGGINDGLEADVRAEEEELRATPEAGIIGAQHTESKSVRQSNPRDEKSWTPGKSHTSQTSSEGRNQDESAFRE